jgi:hypothetical protein
MSMTEMTEAAPARATRREKAAARLLVWLLAVSAALSAVAVRAGAARRDEEGSVTTDHLAWIVFGVLTIVAVGVLVKALGSRVVNWVQTQLGV